jgi:hypothetical protein
MREVTYIDPDGRMWAHLLPDDLPDSDAEVGLPLGPPPLAALGLAIDVEVRLHNQLFHRRIFTEADARRRSGDVLLAITAAFKVDVKRVIDLAYAVPSEG